MQQQLYGHFNDNDLLSTTLPFFLNNPHAPNNISSIWRSLRYEQQEITSHSCYMLNPQNADFPRLQKVAAWFPCWWCWHRRWVSSDSSILYLTSKVQMITSIKTVDGEWMISSFLLNTQSVPLRRGWDWVCSLHLLDYLTLEALLHMRYHQRVCLLSERRDIVFTSYKHSHTCTSSSSTSGLFSKHPLQKVISNLSITNKIWNV